MPPRLSIIIPTQRRPGPLAVAARSVFAQEGVDWAQAELVIADNDAEPSAAAAARALGQGAPLPVRYVHEPAPGVSNARNAGVAAAQGELLAFLDDDQEAQPRWLAELLAARERLGAQAVFGPVNAALPAQVRRHRRYFERFFTHPGPAQEGLVPRGYGAGVCLIERAALPDPQHPFAASRNQTGGEDDALFAAMIARGARMGWNPLAWVWEHPDPGRVTLGYAMRRTFTYGQGGTNGPLLARPPRRGRAVFSVATGAVQALALGGLSAGLWLVRWPDRAFVYDKALRGLGKVLFARPFHLQFYGLTRAQRPGGAARPPRA